jgi:multiple sugar transport system permease protein
MIPLDARRHEQRRRDLRQAIGRYAFAAPAMLFIVLALVYPLGYNVYLALHDVTIATLLRGQAPFAGLANYRALFADPTFAPSLLISAVFTLASLALQFTLGFALALLFRQPFPGAGTMRALLLLGWLLPIVVSANVWRWILDGDFGALNALLMGTGLLGHGEYWLSQPVTALVSVVAVNVWIGIPFNMILLLAGLNGLPESVFEAGRLDGAGAWQRFRYLTLPMMRPVALTVLLLSFVYTFKVFDLVYVLTGGGPVAATTTLPIYTYQTTFTAFRFGQGAAAATVLLVISLVVAGFYLRLIRREEAS